jgi:hypothetical protein
LEAVEVLDAFFRFLLVAVRLALLLALALAMLMVLITKMEVVARLVNSEGDASKKWICYGTVGVE